MADGGTGITDMVDAVLDELAGLFARVDGAAAMALARAVGANGGALFVAGAGRSGLLLRCFAMRLMHMGREVHVVGEVTAPAARPGDLLFIGSGSGETGSLVSMAEKAKRLGVGVALVTTNPDSTLGRLADTVATLPAPTPKAAGGRAEVASAQPMGNLFEQGMFLLLDAVVMLLMRETGMTSERMFERHANLE